MPLVEAMDHTITGFIDFLGQRSESQVMVTFEAARQAQDAYGEELSRLTGV